MDSLQEGTTFTVNSEMMDFKFPNFLQKRRKERKEKRRIRKSLTQ